MYTYIHAGSCYIVNMRFCGFSLLVDLQKHTYLCILLYIYIYTQLQQYIPVCEYTYYAVLCLVCNLLHLSDKSFSSLLLLKTLTSLGCALSVYLSVCLSVDCLSVTYAISLQMSTTILVKI